MAQIPAPGSISFEDRVTKKVPFEWGFGSTPRVAKLRDQLYFKASVVDDWGAVFASMYDSGALSGKMRFRKNIRLDMDRARIVTKSFKETDGFPQVIRKAKAIEKLCNELPIFIKPGELIVGDPNSAPDEVRWYPELSVEWMPDAVSKGGFSIMVTDEERKEISEDICPYWKENCLEELIVRNLPPQSESMFDCIYGAEVMGGVGYKGGNYSEAATGPAYDFDKLYSDGIKARIERAEAQVSKLEDNMLKMNPEEYLEKKNNWRAMAIAGRAIIRFAERYAELARELAAAETDENRRNELEEIAATLDWVPANSPRTFREALQFYWIIEVVGRYMAIHGYGNGIRLDQIWWPYYVADMKSDRITRAQALELVELLFLKIQEVGIAASYPPFFIALAGGEIYYTANLGGTKNGTEDACNDLTALCMEVQANVRLNQPPIAIRYHRNINPAIVQRAIDLERSGTGHPSWFNEDLLEKWGLIRGFSPEMAKDTAAAGCVANYVKGRFVAQTTVIEAGAFAGPKILEQALTQGGDLMFGIGECKNLLNTKDPREMTSADELLDAWTAYLLHHAKNQLMEYNVAKQISFTEHPDPTNSLLLDMSLDDGIEAQKLNATVDGWPNYMMMGRQNVGDSLAAIQKLVFDEKKYTMDQLITGLRANWEDREEMRQDFLNAPKYGNDDNFADEWQRKINVRFEETVNQLHDAWGFRCTGEGSVVILYQLAGLACAASPDGRMAGEHLADGSTSPMAGADHNGPTAVINSAGKVPYMHTQLFNQRFQPMWLEKENKELFAAYLRQWYDTGNIGHVQFNVADSAALHDAQEHPENYQDLQVRVAGFSAFFVDLPKETQDSIVARSEQAFT